MQASRSQQLLAEFVGSLFLLATVVGSGIMAERLAGGNIAIALLGNTLPTGAILVVLITMLGPVSGAHFNPAVSLVFRLRRELSTGNTVFYILAQLAGAVCGVLLAHVMFDLPVLELSQKVRTGHGQWVSEFVAAFGLITTILATLRARPEMVATSVGLYITAAYWFTASTSFANPAVTIARSLTDSFAGISLAGVPAFIVAQLAGALAAVFVCKLLLGDNAHRSAKLTEPV